MPTDEHTASDLTNLRIWAVEQACGLANAAWLPDDVVDGAAKFLAFVRGQGVALAPDVMAEAAPVAIAQPIEPAATPAPEDEAPDTEPAAALTFAQRRQEQIAKVSQMRRSGVPVVKIAEALQMSVPNVYTLLTKAKNAEMPPRIPVKRPAKTANGAQG